MLNGKTSLNSLHPSSPASGGIARHELRDVMEVGTHKAKLKETWNDFAN